jgi:1-acyl-sn-glycerol-3-phosphate acyltransferase
VPELVYPPIILLAKTCFRAFGLRFVMADTENVPRSGGAVLASNHVSYLDFIFAGLAAQDSHRLVRFMAKDVTFTHPASGPLMRGMKHIPVDRAAGSASYRAALEALRRGEVIGVFPEATISRSFLLKDFKTGAVRLAMRAEVPLVPMVTWGGQRMFTKDHPRDLHRGRTISIKVGEPLRPARTDNAEQVTAQLRERMAALLDDVQRGYPDGPDGPDDRWWLPQTLGGTAPSPAEAAARDAAELAARAARRRAVS